MSGVIQDSKTLSAQNGHQLIGKWQAAHNNLRQSVPEAEGLSSKSKCPEQALQKLKATLHSSQQRVAELEQELKALKDNSAKTDASMAELASKLLQQDSKPEVTTTLACL